MKKKVHLTVWVLAAAVIVAAGYLALQAMGGFSLVVVVPRP